MKPHIPPGISSHTELGMRFVVWANSLKRFPGHRDVMAAFDVSRSTAFRYLNAYRDVVSMEGAGRKVA